MTTNHKVRVLALASVAMMVSGLAAADIPKAAPIDPQTMAAIKAVLEQHPELVANAMQATQRADQDKRTAALNATVSPIIQEIAAAKNVPFAGKASGHLVVEFFDYNCGYCKQFAKSSELPLLASDKNVHFVYIFTPILSDGSKRLAEIAAAAYLQGKFKPAHDFLIAQEAQHATSDAADTLIPGMIKAAGLDETKLRLALSDGSAAAVVKKHLDWAHRGQVSGTPMIWAGGKAQPGAIPLAPLVAMIEAAPAS